MQNNTSGKGSYFKFQCLVIISTFIDRLESNLVNNLMEFKLCVKNVEPLEEKSTNWKMIFHN